jgi:hypothetical protein
MGLGFIETKGFFVVYVYLGEPTLVVSSGMKIRGGLEGDPERKSKRLSHDSC